MSVRGILSVAAMFGVHGVLPESRTGRSRVRDTADESVHKQQQTKAEAKRARKAARRLAEQEAGQS